MYFTEALCIILFSMFFLLQIEYERFVFRDQGSVNKYLNVHSISARCIKSFSYICDVRLSFECCSSLTSYKGTGEKKKATMPVAMETSVSRLPLPVPTHFSHAEQSFSLKKRRVPFSSSSTSNSSVSSPTRLSHSLPPQPPSKGCPPLSRMFPQHPSPWTPLSGSLTKSPSLHYLYDPNKQLSFFNQCFTNLGLLGRGSFGEVYKVSKTKLCVCMRMRLI